MLDVMIWAILTITGLASGSFVNALVWRLHKLETVKSKSDKKQFSIVQGRSMCPKCHHKLAWYDLIPVLSWALLHARCRYCKKPISWWYPLVEVIFSVMVVVSYICWPYNFTGVASWVLFTIWVVVLLFLITLSIYDLRWKLLPNTLIYPLAGVSVVFGVAQAIQTKQLSSAVAALVGAALLGGFFWLLYQLSNGKWIGGGDVRYGFIMGALLGWQKTILGLVLSSYLGMVVIVGIVLAGKYKKHLQLPFGPLLIAATYASFLWGQHLVDIYKRISGL